MNYEETIEAFLEVCAKIGRFLRKFSIWAILTGVAFSAVYVLISFGVQANAAAHPEQNIMMQIFSVLVSVAVIVGYVIASEKIWRSENFSITW